MEKMNVIQKKWLSNDHGYLNGVADVDRSGLRVDEIAEVGTLQVVDAEVNPSYSSVPRSHVSPHARQRLRYHRRHAAVQHLKRLPHPHFFSIRNKDMDQQRVGGGGERKKNLTGLGGDWKAAGDFGGRQYLDLEIHGV